MYKTNKQVYVINMSQSFSLMILSIAALFYSMGIDEKVIKRQLTVCYIRHRVQREEINVETHFI